MSDPKSKKGVIRRAGSWYVGRLASGAKGAVGVESFRLLGRIFTSSKDAIADSLKYQQCPRCRERSLVEVGEGAQCLREDICGFQAADQQEVAQFRQAMEAVDGRVIALAKGHDGGFAKRAAGAINLSRLFWGITFFILCYSLSWLFDSNIIYAVWVALVAVWTGMQAMRFAYAAHRLMDEQVVQPLVFLSNPSMWFPLKTS